MQVSLQGKIALVTGGGRGIGRATALALAEAGADVAVAARTAAELAAVAEEVRALGRRALPVVADVSQEDQVESLVRQVLAEFRRIDILVNNAGVSGRCEVADLPLADWQRTLSVNATGTFLCSRAVVPVMRRHGGGRIINVVSGNGRQGQARNAAYSASKFAVMGFSQSLAQEVLNDNITVSCVLPGPTDTALRRNSTPNEDRTLLLRPEDVAEVILFLVTRPDNVVIAEVPVRPRIYASGVA